MKDLISVVIPAYNVEAYIDKCLRSVLEQTYDNLEIIVIDDGSTDSTLAKLHKYSDSRLKIIAKPNGGVSSARNIGIDSANGKYLAFVDSDDYLEPEMYASLYTALTSADADMAVCDYNLVYDGYTVKEYSNIRNETVRIYEDVYGYFCKYCACPKPNNYIWTRLYNTEIVKSSGVRFENYKLGDDTLFNFKLLPHLRTVAFIAGGGYNYFQRSNSNVYTVANKGNLAKVYADTFDSLAEYWQNSVFTEWLIVLSAHAFTRMRSVYYYSRLAGLSDDMITKNIIDGFKGRLIADYLTGAK